MMSGAGDQVSTPPHEQPGPPPQLAEEAPSNSSLRFEKRASHSLSPGAYDSCISETPLNDSVRDDYATTTAISDQSTQKQKHFEDSSINLPVGHDSLNPTLTKGPGLQAQSRSARCLTRADLHLRSTPPTERADWVQDPPSHGNTLHPRPQGQRPTTTYPTESKTVPLLAELISLFESMKLSDSYRPSAAGLPQAHASLADFFPRPLEEWGAKRYYAGVPSTPPLVARTSTTPLVFWRLKELRPVGKRALQGVWEDKLAPTLHTLLGQLNVEWTSMDVVRIGSAGESSAPVILWIGVMPTSLSRELGVIVAHLCRDHLIRYGITDVDVEIRESVVSRLAGPKLLKPTTSSKFTGDIRERLTTTLGVHIYTEWVEGDQPVGKEGTGGFFITEGKNSERLLLVTVRHVALPLRRYENEQYDGEPRREVSLFGAVGYDEYVGSIQAQIDAKAKDVRHQKKVVKGRKGKAAKAGGGKKGEAAKKYHQSARKPLHKLKGAKEEFTKLKKRVQNDWGAPENRVLGHVILSSPQDFNVGSEGYTEDLAIIEVDSSKVDASNFKGSAINLGTRIRKKEFIRMMNSGHEKAHCYKYPRNRLLKLRGTIPDEEMRNPAGCVMVIKRGVGSGLTVGCANNFKSYTFFRDGEERITKDWTILPGPHCSTKGTFSVQGDSGSVIVDGRGRIGGLLTGSNREGLTYATPISFLLKRMEDSGLHQPNLNPSLAAQKHSRK